MIDNLNQLVAEACRRYTSIEGAMGWADKQLCKDGALRKRILKPVIIAGLSAAINDERNRQRRAWKNTCAELIEQPGVSDLMAGLKAKTILDTWTIGDKLLGDATKADLEAAEAILMVEADGKLETAGFYHRLGDKLPSRTSRVRKHLTGQQALEILARVCAKRRKQAVA